MISSMQETRDTSQYIYAYPLICIKVTKIIFFSRSKILAAGVLGILWIREILNPHKNVSEYSSFFKWNIIKFLSQQKLTTMKFIKLKVLLIIIQLLQSYVLLITCTIYTSFNSFFNNQHRRARSREGNSFHFIFFFF